MYIGKSISLKTRLKQHYEGYKQGNTKAVKFIPQTNSIYLKIVNNDLEAVITEANFIKTYQPRYNSITKDGKSNPYIVFTNSPNTKIKIIHATDLQLLELDNYKKQVFGPYTSVKTAKILVKLVRHIFGFCDNPYNSRNKACFYYHINQCPGACISIITPTQYNRLLGQIKKFLSGQFIQLKRNLARKINIEIKKQNYEEASVIKDRIQSLEQALNNQNSALFLKLSDSGNELHHLIVTTLCHPQLKKPPHRIECYDLAHLQGDDYVGSMSVFINGIPESSKYRHFNIRSISPSDPHAMKEIITRRFKHPEWGTPDMIVLDGGIPQLSVVFPVVPSNIPIIALAKMKETIYFYDDKKVITLNLKIEDPVLNLLKYIRDESHRFATTFHIKKRQKSLLA